MVFGQGTEKLAPDTPGLSLFKFIYLFFVGFYPLGESGCDDVKGFGIASSSARFGRVKYVRSRCMSAWRRWVKAEWLCSEADEKSSTTTKYGHLINHY